MKILNYANCSQGIGLPEKSQKNIEIVVKGNYSDPTKAKSLVGIGTPFNTEAHRRQQFNLAGFFMRTICTPFIISLAKLYPNYGGLIEGASARRSLCGGSSNLDQSTTNSLEPLGGGFKKSHKEAATMATTPTLEPSKIYTFAIGNPKALHADFNKNRTISLISQSEAQARATLSGLRLTFIKSLPVKSQEAIA
ncbi:ash family protein [Vibrio algivorus]|uniref:Host cell division inhibitor Icd-like protein n=1 Tax=Vibrio algivorus TaxID=1667024 RepID=A0A557P6C0_9VIBR|nr:ash family protein [Vibrio algivorus]TVO36200.1 hypothetical protein FOF44_09825 [Vibrio algivorus]